jgi:ankyrin repeat protein
MTVSTTFTKLLGCGLLLALAGTATAQDLRLVEAAKKQDTQAIGLLLRQKVDVNARHADGTTALHWAAYRDDLPTLNLLLSAGALPNTPNELGVTPLYLACRNGSAAIVNKLLSSGANPNLGLPTGESPLMAAARAGNVVAVKALLAHGAQVNVAESAQKQTALMWAVAAQHPDVVRMLVEAGADIRARTAVTKRLVYTGFRYITAPPGESSGTVFEVPEGGFTPLLFAAQQGNVESVRLLLDAGADVNDTAPIGTSALVVATHSGHRDAATLLLDRGADPNADAAGYTALHAAVLLGDVESVRALLAHGAKPNVKLTKGNPVRKYGQEYALTANWKGATPLWLAARFGEPAILQVLGAAGADPRLAADDGTLPLHVAVPSRGQGDRRERYMTDSEAAAVVPEEEERQTLESIEAILALGVDVNTPDKAGDTVLHLATGKLYNRVIQYLAENGADLEIKNKRGLTPLAALTASRRGPGAGGGAAAAAAAAGGGAAELQLGPAPPSTAGTAELLRKLGAK